MPRTPHANWSPFDEQCMRRALRAASRERGRVEPNPMVGCVIARGRKIISEGRHRRFGGPHAEVDALARCPVSPRGATVYVTLEPCRHFGKQPPCTRALLDAGVKRVVAAMVDPNPPMAGRGLAELRRAGIQVECGLLEAEARALNAPFLKRLATGRPWVIAKWAQSLDGRLATRTGDSRWITGPEARRHAHGVRAVVDAILVGVSTVIADDPLLTARHAPPRRVAARIVLDPRLRAPRAARLVQTAAEAPTWIVCANSIATRRMRPFETAGCRLLPLPARRGRLDLPALLTVCGNAGMSNLLIEGGAITLGAFFDDDLVDEVNAYLAPIILGGDRDAESAFGRGTERVADATRLEAPRMIRLGADWLLSGRSTSAYRV